MRNPTARLIRDILSPDSPSPKSLSPDERRIYRRAKRLYAKTPSNRKTHLLTSLTYQASVQRAQKRAKDVIATDPLTS